MAEAEAKPIFTEQVAMQPCSWASCPNGHRWPPRVLVVGCPGCGGPYLAFQQQNCPFCNEPTIRVNLRVDAVPAGSGGVPRCRGAKPFGETMDVTLERHGHQEAAASWKDFMTKAEEAKSVKPAGNA